MNIEIYTDGSCSGNPGVGGYAGILLCNGQRRIVKGFSTDVRTTNNSMELKAIRESIGWLNKFQKKPCNVTIYTDSKYVIDCATGKNKDGSKRTVGWFKGRKNEGLWVEFITEVMKGKHTITFVKVKGHSGVPLNEEANAMAQEECTRAKHELVKGAVR